MPRLQLCKSHHRSKDLLLPSAGMPYTLMDRYQTTHAKWADIRVKLREWCIIAGLILGYHVNFKICSKERKKERKKENNSI